MWCKTVKGSGLCAFRGAACLPVMFLFAAFAHAAALPDGPGKAETIRICGKCHSLEQAVSLRQGQAGWTETISKMVNLGAEGSDAEFRHDFELPGEELRRRKPEPVRAGPGSIDRASAPDSLARTVRARPGERPTRKRGRFRIGKISKLSTPVRQSRQQRNGPLTVTIPAASASRRSREMTPENVGGLKIAWIYHMRPAGFAAGAGRFATGEGAGLAEPSATRPERLGGAARPRGAEGRLRVPSQRGNAPGEKRHHVHRDAVFARGRGRPGDGKELWSFHLPSGNPSTRGVEFWAGDEATPAQVVFGSSDGKLYSPGCQNRKAEHGLRR